MFRLAHLTAHRALWRVACLAALLLMAGNASGAKSKTPREVKEPHYGEVLFYFYQQKYFSALTHLMAAQHFKQLGVQASEGELLRGGMLLSYGQHIEAGRIFDQLIEDGAPLAVRNRAWFYLAKIRYQRGYLEEAEQAVARIEGALPGELEDERLILHALLMMARQDYQQAADLMAGMRSKSDWVHYGRYNLGVALIKAGETDKGVVLLDQVGNTPVKGEELDALRDKANVALGFTFLQGGQYDLARKYLERVRLNGLLSNKALLGMGWAHSANDQMERALVHWTELHDRSRLDSAVQESLLAVPYALGKLGAYQRSLEKYEEAIDVYVREMKRLDASIAAIRAGKLMGLFLQEDPIEEMGWFWNLEKLPDTPESHYLEHLLSGHDFQEALKNYRDLRFLQARLDQWSSDVGIYQDMLDARRAAFAKRLPAVQQSRRAQDLAKLTAARTGYADELARIESESRVEALATDKEQELLARLERIRQLLARQVDATSEAQQRYHLLRGLLTWDITADFASRLWQAKSSLNELDRLLQEAGTRRDALERAQQEMPRAFQAFDERIRELLPRIRQLRGTSNELARAQEVHLGELAITELLRQQERLATYLTQARFAVAQIYDQSSSSPKQEAP